MTDYDDLEKEVDETLREYDRKILIPRWLKRRLTLEEAKAHLGIDDCIENRSINYCSVVPRKNKLEAEWDTVAGQILDGDELWLFRSPPCTWKHHEGRAGIALVRNGEVIRYINTEILIIMRPYHALNLLKAYRQGRLCHREKPRNDRKH